MSRATVRRLEIDTIPVRFFKHLRQGGGAPKSRVYSSNGSLMNDEKSNPDASYAGPFSTGQHFRPVSSRVEVEFGAHSRRGTASSVNQDHYLITRLARHQETVKTSLPPDILAKRFEEHGWAMVVADGLDDAGSGEVASRLAIATLMHLVLYFSRWNLRIDDEIAHEIMQRAEQFYQHVDVVMAYPGPAGAAQGLQTTMTAVFGAGLDVFFAHVGHSRAYLLREGRLMRLTHDHTLGGEQGKTRVPIAPLVDVNALARDLKHVLTQTLGMGGPGPKIDLERFQLADDDTVLVCTNGLTDVVEEETLAKVLGSTRSSEDQSRALIDLAIDAGGEDDATALVAHYHIRE
jgi:PPM family protein phosphatase